MGERSTKHHCSNPEKTNFSNARAYRSSFKKKSGSFTVDKEQNSLEVGAKLATTIDGEAVHELVPKNSSFCTKRKRMGLESQGSFYRDEHARDIPDAHTPKHTRDSSVSQMDDSSNSDKQVLEQHKHTGPRQINAQASTPTSTLRIEEEELKVSTNVQNLRDERLIASGAVCSSVSELEEGEIASDISGLNALPYTAVIERDSDTQSTKEHRHYDSNLFGGIIYDEPYGRPRPELCRIHKVIIIDDDDSSDVDMPSQEEKGDALKTVTSTLLCKENTIQASEISTCSLTSHEATTKASVVALEEEANFDVQQSDIVQSHAPLSTEIHSLVVQPVTDTSVVVLEEEVNIDVQQSNMVQSHAPLSTETHSLVVQPVTDISVVVLEEEANIDVQQSDMVQSHACLSTETHSLVVQPVTDTSVVVLEEEANIDVQQSDMVQSHARLSTETHLLLVQPVTDTSVVVLEEEENIDVQQSDMVQSHAPLSTEIHSLLVHPITDNLSRNSHVCQMQLPVSIIPSSIEEPVPCMPEPLVSQLEPSGATHASMEELAPCMPEPLVLHPEPIGATHVSIEKSVPCMPEPLVSRLECSGSRHAFSSENRSLREPLENPLQQTGFSVINTQLPTTSVHMSANEEHVQDDEDIIILDDFPVDDYPEINEVNVSAYLNPLELDMQRLLEQATKTHADQILQLNAARDKELEEMRRRRLDAEDVLRETYERLKMNYEKVYMNYLLAEVLVRKEQVNYLTFGFPETCTSQSMVVHAQRGGLQHCPATPPTPTPLPPPLQRVNYASSSFFTSPATPSFRGSFRNSAQQSPSPHLISYMPSNLPVLSSGFRNQQSHKNFSMASSILELTPLQSIRPENIQIPVGNRSRQAYQHPSSWTRQYIRPQGSLNYWPVQLG